MEHLHKRYSILSKRRRIYHAVIQRLHQTRTPSQDSNTDRNVEELLHHQVGDSLTLPFLEVTIFSTEPTLHNHRKYITGLPRTLREVSKL